MHKYFAVFKLVFMRLISYRMEALLWMFVGVFPIMVTMATWKSIFGQKALVSGITFSGIILYYLAVIFIDNMTSTHFEQEWIQKVQKGELDIYFLKPVKLPVYLFFEMLSRKFIGALTFILPFMMVAAACASGFVSSISMTPISLLFFLAFMVCNVMINFVISFIIVLSTMWMGEAETLSHVKWICAGVFGGMMAPLQFYPQWLQNIANYLPFKRMIALPATLFTHQYTISYLASELGILCLYVLLFSGGLFVLWKKAIEKYTSFGG